ncbi:cation:proton antiporter [Georhizobium profundi]|uniref:cation:proton antiporter n=1 Tax=Georhizobium profundi TaxID=2341112 RepID=UPI00247A7193|nr:cation:proton antiporter [Georhizobium profundi]
MTELGPILEASLTFAFVILSLALLLCVYRVIKGPTLPDRVVALDMLVAVAIGLIAAIGIYTGFTLYVDIAIALALVGFLATVAFARFILVNAERGASQPNGTASREQTAVEEKVS